MDAFTAMSSLQAATLHHVYRDVNMFIFFCVLSSFFLSFGTFWSASKTDLGGAEGSYLEITFFTILQNFRGQTIIQMKKKKQTLKDKLSNNEIQLLSIALIPQDMAHLQLSAVMVIH